MRITFISTHFPPEYQFGGTVRSAGGLVVGLLRAGAEVKVVTTSPAADGPVAFDWSGTSGELSRFSGRRAKSYLSHRWAFAPRFLNLCRGALRDADAVYINGIGTFPNTVASYLCRSQQIPFVEAVRGGFEPYRVRYHRFRKMAYFRAVTLPLLSRAGAVHATSEAEAESCRAMGVTNRIVVIPNGVFPEEYESIPNLSSLEEFESLIKGRKFVLYASRLSWEKGLDILAQAWEQVRLRHGDHCLLIAGSADRPRYEKTARKFFGEEVGRSVYFLGRVPGEKLRVLYAAADLFVLPSYSENFGNVVVEAMASGTPVVTTTGTPWKVIEEKNFGRWVEPTADAIARALDEMLLMGDATLKEIGQRAREFALREYSWYHIGREMYAVLREVAGM